MVDAQQGLVGLKVGVELDHERSSSPPRATPWLLTALVTASDGSLSSSAWLHVTIANEDEPPVVTWPTGLSVDEDAPVGTVVGTVSATDPDGDVVV